MLPGGLSYIYNVAPFVPEVKFFIRENLGSYLRDK